MIELTRLNKTPFILNCDMIETVEAKPDTTIKLNNGTLYIVRESVEDVVAATVRYKRSLFEGILG